MIKFTQCFKLIIWQVRHQENEANKQLIASYLQRFFRLPKTLILSFGCCEFFSDEMKYQNTTDLLLARYFDNYCVHWLSLTAAPYFWRSDFHSHSNLTGDLPALINGVQLRSRCTLSNYIIDKKNKFAYFKIVTSKPS